MKDCVFCKIVEGKVSASKVYENNKVLAFLDIGPVHKGHTLVIPKEHYKTLMDVPDELLKEVIVVVKNVSKAVIKAVNADGISLAISNHEAAGQLVPHAHFHIMPRHKGDGLRHWPQGKYEEGEMQEYAEKIKEEL